MTRTLHPPRPGTVSRNGTSPQAPARRPRRNGRFVLFAVGLVTLALAVATFAALEPKPARSHDVLVARRAVRAGEVIGPDDLRVVSVASSEFAGIPVSRRDQIVRHTVTLDVAAGQPLVNADIGAAPGPGQGEAVIGLSLASGRLPAGLSPGDSVVAVNTPGSANGAANGTTDSTSGMELSSGRILNVGKSPDGTRTDISLIIPATQSSAVAAASASDSVSLVWIAKPSKP